MTENTGNMTREELLEGLGQLRKAHRRHLMSAKNIRLLGWVLFFILFIAGIAWAIWQYRLCMATIGDFWYCIQHAI